MDAAVDLLHRVARATVTVGAEIPASHPSAPLLGTNRLGSGTVVAPDVVLTVGYATIGASRVRVTDVEGHSSKAEVVAQDFATGIAVLRSELPALTPVVKGDSRNCEIGKDAFIVASVGADERRSSSGVITSLDSFDAYWEYRLERALWLSCPNPGLGGGPVCNASGELLGVVSLNLGAVGRASFAIPSEYYYDFADEFLRYGHRTSRLARAWIGVFCHAFPDRIVIAGVIPGSPAQRAGLEPGDVVVRIDRRSFSSREDLYERIWAHEPGDTVLIEVYRNGQLVEVQVDSVDADEFLS